MAYISTSIIGGLTYYLWEMIIIVLMSFKKTSCVMIYNLNFALVLIQMFTISRLQNLLFVHVG